VNRSPLKTAPQPDDTTGMEGGTVAGETEQGRHYAGSIIGVLLAYLRREYGDHAVTDVLRSADERRPLDLLEDVDHWSSHGQVTKLYNAAVEVTGDPDVGRRAGEELIRQYRGTAVETLLRELGSPAAVLENVTQTAAKFSTALEMEAVEVGPTHAVVFAAAAAGFPRIPVMCGYTKGVLSQASALFGMDLADVEERQCQAHGAPRCEYVVRWDPATIEQNLQRRIEHLESELLAVTTRFNALQETASELVGAQDVEELLRCITKQAVDTVRAPQHVLAVRTSDNGPLRVHAFGLDDDQIDATVAEIMTADMHDSRGSRLIVEVASRTTCYGRLAAIYPREASFLPAERRLLTAYAGHAAAALEAAAARQEAERRNATARALLELASSLAQVGTQADVASRLAETVPDVVDCDACGVFLSDDDGSLRLVGASGYGRDVEAVLRTIRIAASDDPALTAMMQSRQPAFLSPETAAKPLRPILLVAGSVRAVVMPISYRDEFFGVVTASVKADARRLDHDDHLLERLHGMASHAATALLNARLLEQISHQATHDGLTGLPNRLVLKQAAEQAATRARESATTTALLFVDLDGFKSVNDSLGHAAGDALLVEVAARLACVVRPSDVVARLGGDEFAILVADVDERDCAAVIESVTERIRTAIERPYNVDGRNVEISASIGISTLQEGDDYESLLRRGDLAMYETKRVRRRRASTAPPSAASTTG
jgi:uncharacterized protein (TIGR02265 family)